MRIINCSTGTIADSQFEEVKVSKYYRDRFPVILQRLTTALSPEGRAHEVARLVKLVKELDVRNAGKVCFSAFIEPSILEEIAKAFLQEGFDTYRCNLKGEDVTWIDPR